MSSIFNDSKVDALINQLQLKSQLQEGQTSEYIRNRTGPWRGMEPRDHAHFADKLVALEREKCEFCYLLCRAIGARRIVEAGTSYGVSTLYLAAAVRDNGGGVVIGSEYEPLKAQAARENFAAAGLSQFIELREGDLLQTFKSIPGPIDFVLFDIWTDVVRPTLDLLLPLLRPGSLVCADNTAGERSRQNYAAFFQLIEDPARGFHTLTIPFHGGFEVALKT